MRKKNWTDYLVYAGLFIMLFFAACNEEPSNEEQEEELRKLEAYLEENNITQEPTESGMYYLEIEPGDGSTYPAEDDYVEFEFAAQLIDGTIFYTSNETIAENAGIYDPDNIYGPIRYQLGQMMPGLAEGISYMSEGGLARLIIPSDLALGSSYTSIVPPYSTLIYDIELTEVISDPDQYERQQIQAYLDSNNIDVDSTSTGLYYIENELGTGEQVENGSTVTIWYTGYYLDGRVFDSNIDGSAFIVSLPSENLIDGWVEGLKLMKEGGKATLIVPHYLAYGAEGYYDNRGRTIVPPYKTLLFDVWVADVNK